MNFSRIACRIAVVNPEFKRLEEHVDDALGVLKSLRQDLNKALADYEDVEEFSKFFKEELAEEEELKKLLQKSKSASVVVAGIWDKLKWFFKKPKDVEEDTSIHPSYMMDVDEFVEGKSEWADPSYYMEKEREDNKLFFDGVSDVLKSMEKIRIKPSKPSIDNLMSKIDILVKSGESIKKGLYKHLLEPAARIELEEDKVETKPSTKPTMSLEGAIDHYSDILKEHSGDPTKSKSLLKEFFNAVSPYLEEEKAQMASVTT
jgi:hypothetical protein